MRRGRPALPVAGGARSEAPGCPADLDHAWLRVLSIELVMLRQRLGDLDCALLLAALACNAGEISALRLAMLTGIPRQTVRRKLQDLARQGLAEQAPSHAWRLGAGPAVAAALRTSDTEGVGQMVAQRRTRG